MLWEEGRIFTAAISQGLFLPESSLLLSVRDFSFRVLMGVVNGVGERVFLPFHACLLQVLVPYFYPAP